jgi:polar amino acid transport system substrate-binding protein
MFLLLLGACCALARAEPPVLITGEWPPYTGLAEPQGGSVTAVVRDAFSAVGVEVRIGFFAWYRVRDMMSKNRDLAGYFPNYYSADRARHFYFSQPVGESPLGLAEQRGAPLAWKTIADLRRYRIGTVRTYVNSPALDQLVANGKIVTVAAVDDAENLHHLLDGKVEAAVIDRNVYAYLLSHDESLRDAEQRLTLNPRVLVVQKMYVCFPHTRAGKALRDRFNHGLRGLQAPSPASGQ